MIVSGTVLLAFVVTSLPLILAPGPSVAFVLATTLGSGRRSGLAGVAGVEIGYLVHVLGAAVGASAVIAASAEAFTVVKLAGAAYLVWLGVAAWRSRDETRLGDLARAGIVRSTPAAFRNGLLVGALNPKTAVFFLSFLPQFAAPERGPVWGQMSILGVIFILLATIPDTCWALAGGALPRLFPKLRMRAMQRVSGSVYLGLAAYTLTARRAV